MHTITVGHGHFVQTRHSDEQYQQSQGMTQSIEEFFLFILGSPVCHVYSVKCYTNNDINFGFSGMADGQNFLSDFRPPQWNPVKVT